MELSDYREQLDKIDGQLLELFTQRMDIAAEIAAWKQEKNLPVLDVRREKEKLEKIEELSRPELSEYSFTLFSFLMELSRSRQNRILHRESAETTAIEKALRETPTVFSAVEKGLCRYGVIPVENSTAGTVNAVYDLMIKHDFRIVRSVRIKVDHNLLVKPGTKLEDIREIYSHGQALTQCASFLQRFPNAKVIPCENTAVASKMVAEAEEPGVAAISSRSCAKLYGLEILMPSVQDSADNYTRFICISKDLEIYPGADHTSLMLVIRDEPGTLYNVLARFYALGINMHKLESRPILGRNWEYRFYFDLDTSVYSTRFIQLMGELRDVCEEYEYLGSYSEVV